METAAIRQHLRQHIEKFGSDYLASARLESRIGKIRTWLRRGYHRRKPPIGVRRITRASPLPEFTAKEMQHLVDLFAGANDPVSASIAAKAVARLASAKTKARA